MTKDQKCKPMTRALYDWEIAEARLVFGEQLDYARVRMHECAMWPTRLHRLRRKFERALSRLRKAASEEAEQEIELNAITLGYHCFFPIQLSEVLIPPGQTDANRPKDIGGMGWLIHELTHCWQYQHTGLRYLWRALQAQLFSQDAYGYAKAKGLREKRAQGKTIEAYNPEQQGDIARHYYEQLRKGQDVTEWAPYIADIQK